MGRKQGMEAYKVGWPDLCYIFSLWTQERKERVELVGWGGGEGGEGMRWKCMGSPRHDVQIKEVQYKVRLNRREDRKSGLDGILNVSLNPRGIPSLGPQSTLHPLIPRLRGRALDGL